MGLRKSTNQMLSDSYDRAVSQPISCQEYSENLYYVFNADTQNEYFVTVDKETCSVIDCTCKHFIYRLAQLNLPCKHMVAVSMILQYDS